MTKFSVVIPLYNKEKDFPLTLSSVLAQAYTDFEVIIINDGSTDGSLAIAETEALKDKRIKIFTNKNQGLAATRNYGVEKANCTYIAFLDADDYWEPWHLENLNTILLNFPEAQWFSAAYKKVYNYNLTRKMVSPLDQKGDDWIGKINFFKNSLADSMVHPSCLGMKKSFFLNLGGHNTNITFAEDTDLWIRAALKAPLYFSNKVSAKIILNSSNRINHSKLNSRTYPNFDDYASEAKKNPALRKYIDVHLFSIALGYKLAGDSKNFNDYKSKISLKNLNSKQVLLLKTPRKVVLASKLFKQKLQDFGVYFSIYR